MRSMTDYGHVGIFCGGHSHERAISMQSGQAVYEALVAMGLQVSLIDTANSDVDFDRYDRGFIVLHGRDGEDGKFQAILEKENIPYTGSGVEASSLSMNKWHTKAVWESAGLPTPNYHVIGPGVNVGAGQVEMPCYVKPIHEGSSLGMSYVVSECDLKSAIERAQQFDSWVLIEQAILGKEYTASFLDHCDDLPLIGLEPQGSFYDYDAKYVRSDTCYIIAPDLSDTLYKKCKSLAQYAFDLLGMKGWGRIDFMLDNDAKPWLIEANSVPGLTKFSLLPKAAKAVGMSFTDVCLSILETSYAQ